MQTDPPCPDSTHDSHYDQQNDRYVYHYDPDGTATLTTTIVHAISEIADTDVTQGEFSLYDSVDPEALERIFAPNADGQPRVDGYVAFTILGHEVYVHANGDVIVYPPTGGESATTY